MLPSRGFVRCPALCGIGIAWAGGWLESGGLFAAGGDVEFDADDVGDVLKINVAAEEAGAVAPRHGGDHAVDHAVRRYAVLAAASVDDGGGGEVGRYVKGQQPAAQHEPA